MRTLDTYPDHSLVPVTQLRKIWRPLIDSRRQDVNGHPVRHSGHLLVEPVPAGDLERDQADLPRAPGDLERPLDPADVQHVDGRGAEHHSAPHRDGVHEPAVEVVLAVNSDRRQQAGDRAGGKHGRHQRPAAEPARCRRLDARRDAVERHGQLGELGDRQRLGQHPPERLDRMQVRSGAGQPDGTLEDVLGEGLAEHLAAPELAELVGGPFRIGGDEHPVDRPDRGSDDQVRLDPGLVKRQQHADLIGAEDATAAEHESRPHLRLDPLARHVPMVPSAGPAAGAVSGEPGSPRPGPARTAAAPNLATPGRSSGSARG
jgi:hypothetical protein